MISNADKLTVHHRERHADVYVRQSTAKQVQQHQESQHNQYALVEREIGLGWPPERVHVIDADLGQSGQSVAGVARSVITRPICSAEDEELHPPRTSAGPPV
jgi:hypothetical protein